VKKIQQKLMEWKPLMYSVATLATVALVAGAKWRPR
jgi:hypothetical protein